MTAKLFNLSDERDRRNPPHAYCVVTDLEGREMFRYSVSFRVDGQEFSTNFWAYDLDDAQHRCSCMKLTLTVDGQVYERGWKEL